MANYCEKCKCKVEYNMHSEMVETVIKGVNVRYKEYTAYCKECGTEIYVPEINDENVIEIENAYRKAAGLISISEIQEIMIKYNISAGPLAKLLGFGEVTINRYIEGQLPSKKNSEILLKLKYSRKEMESVLEEGKDRITKIAYSKCRKQINELNKLFSDKKIDLIARFILKMAEDITPLALQKLLYYSQAFYHALFNEDLFVDDCQAWAHGPVYPNVYYKYKDYGYDPIEKPLENEIEAFDKLTISEINLLNSVISFFGCYSGKLLSEMTHSEKPWIEARGNLQPTDRSVTVIKRDTINSYFSEIVENYEIINPCDIIKYSKDMLEKVAISL